MKTKETKNAAVNRKEELYGVILISILLTSMLTVMSVGAFVRSEKGKNPVQTLMVAVKNGFEDDGYNDDGYEEETYDDSDFPPYETYPQTDSEDLTETDPDVSTDPSQETTGPSGYETEPDSTEDGTAAESGTSADTSADESGTADPGTTTAEGRETSAVTDLPVIIKPGDDTETTAAVTDPPVTTTVPVTDPPVTTTVPVTDPPVTTTPVTDPPVTTTPVTDPPVTTTPPETEPPVENEERVNDPNYFHDALFIGDSRTVGLAAYGKIEGATYFARTSANVKNLFNDVKSETEKSGLNLTDFLKKYKFGKIYMLLGINEIGYSFDWIVGNYAADIAKIRELQPDAIIIIQSNMHVTKAKSDANPDTFNNNRLNELNRRLALLADNKTVFYVNICPAFDDENGVMPAGYSGDGVHLYGKYYPLWRDYLINYCKR